MRHEHAEQHVDAIARCDHNPAVHQPVEDIRERHGADKYVDGLSAQHLRITAAQCSATRLEQVADSRSSEERLLRDDIRRHGSSQCIPHGVELVGVDAVRNDREQPPVPGGDLGGGHVGDRTDIMRRPASAVHHEQNGCAQVGGDPGVVRELGRAAYPGVVAADDDHGVAIRGRLVVSVDDRRHGGVRVGVDPVVADPGSRLVRHVDALVIQQEFEDVIVLVVGSDNRPEHTDPTNPPGQQVERPERHHAFAGLAFG